MKNGNYKELKPGDIRTAAKECLQEAGKMADSIFAEKEIRTIENTLAPINQMDILVSNLAHRLSMLKSLHPRKNIRLASEKYLQDISAFSSRFNLDPRLYKAIEDVDVSKADATTKRLKEHMLRHLKRYGANKDEQTREKIFEVRRELVRLSMEFSRNTANAVNQVETSLEELAGVPRSVVSRFKRGKNGNKVLTTNYSDYFPVIQFCEDPDTRRRMVRASHTKAPENQEVLQKLLEKRNELMQLLGYKNWADYAAEVRMSGSADAVEEFINAVNDVSKEPADKETSLLLEYMEKDGLAVSSVEDPDRMYYAEVVKREHFGYDPQEFMDYFPYKQVRDGVLDIYSELFNVKFVLNEKMPTWHNSVDCYDVKENGKLLGRIYLDMHPRNGKYKHAACGLLVSGIDGVQVPESFLMCNFPGGKKSDGAALMQFSQVSTFFHEFGHLLHNIFAGKHKWVEFTGISTEEDFVETPSQLLEEWLFDPRVLQQIGRHHKSGKPIPEELISKLKVAEEFGKALHVRRQIFLSAVSFYLHTHPDPEKLDISKLWDELAGTYSPYVYQKGTHMWTSWGHLTGYSSNYYTYMWSLAIAKDLLTGFDGDNLMDKDVANKYRECVLEPGGARDAADMSRDFLGRDYSLDAFSDWVRS